MIISGKEFFGGQPGTVVQKANATPFQPVMPQQPPTQPISQATSAVGNFFNPSGANVGEEVADVYRGAGSAIAGDLEKYKEKGGIRGSLGNQLETGFNIAGHTAGAIVNTAFGVPLKHVVDFLGDKIGSLPGMVGDKLGIPSLANVKLNEEGLYETSGLGGSEFAKNVTRGAEGVEEKLAQWAEAHPREAEAIGSAVNLIYLGTMAKAPNLSGIKGNVRLSEIPSAIKTGVSDVVGGVKNVANKAIELPNKMIDSATSGISDMGGKLKSQGGGMIERLVTKPTPKAVSNVLRETPQEVFDTYANLARQATESYKNQTPLEYAGTRAQSALDTIQRKLADTGLSKSKVMEQASVGNKPVGNITVKFRQNLDNFLKGKTSIEGDSRLIRDLQVEAKKLGNNPLAKDVDRFIDFAQERIYSSARDLSVPVTDSTTGALRKMVGELNGSLKSKLPDSYRNLNDKYSKIVDIRDELNTKLGKEGERGGSLMKRVFSPSDANTKALFKEVKNLTGIDLVNESTLARAVMEASGDARQASMLEQLQLPKFTKDGVTNFLLNKAIEKFNTPESNIQRLRAMTVTEPQNISQSTPMASPKGGTNINTITQSKNFIGSNPTIKGEKSQPIPQTTQDPLQAQIKQSELKAESSKVPISEAVSEGPKVPTSIADLGREQFAKNAIHQLESEGKFDLANKLSEVEWNDVSSVQDVIMKTLNAVGHDVAKTDPTILNHLKYMVNMAKEAFPADTGAVPNWLKGTSGGGNKINMQRGSINFGAMAEDLGLTKKTSKSTVSALNKAGYSIEDAKATISELKKLTSKDMTSKGQIDMETLGKVDEIISKGVEKITPADIKTAETILKKANGDFQPRKPDGRFDNKQAGFINLGLMAQGMGKAFTGVGQGVTLLGSSIFKPKKAEANTDDGSPLFEDTGTPPTFKELYEGYYQHTTKAPTNHYWNTMIHGSKLEDDSKVGAAIRGGATNIGGRPILSNPNVRATFKKVFDDYNGGSMKASASVTQQMENRLNQIFNYENSVDKFMNDQYDIQSTAYKDPIVGNWAIATYQDPAKGASVYPDGKTIWLTRDSNGWIHIGINGATWGGGDDKDGKGYIFPNSTN